VGAALAALPRIVTEIDGVAPAHSRTYRNILSAVGVLCADRMPLFIKKFCSNGCFQQGCRRISGEPYKTDIFERDYKTDIIDGRATGARPTARTIATVLTTTSAGTAAPRVILTIPTSNRSATVRFATL
jgi:hypothetical protein